MVLYDLSTMSQLNNNYPKFSEQVLGKAPFVMLVYAKWCGHCQRMEDEWKKAVAGTSKTCDIVQVEETVYKHLSAAHPNNTLTTIINQGIRGYPYLAIVSAEGVDGYTTEEKNTSGKKEEFESTIKEVKKAPKAPKAPASPKAKKASKATKATKTSASPKAKKTSKASPKKV
jgi:thiol-disulfide isomerase/thioredoxin